VSFLGNQDEHEDTVPIRKTLLNYNISSYHLLKNWIVKISVVIPLFFSFVRGTINLI